MEIAGLEHLKGLDPKKPTIVISNHSNRLDGFTVFYLRKFNRGKSFYCMMEEEELEKHKLLKPLGAFPIDLNHPVKAAASTRFALRLLDHADTLLWLFPQGEVRKAFEKLEAEPGTHFLANRASQAQILPAAIRYVFFKEEEPKILIRFGKPMSAVHSRPEVLQEMVQELVDNLIHAEQTQDTKDFYKKCNTSHLAKKLWERFCKKQGEGVDAEE